MVQAQERFQKKVEGFMFNMGFSGYYFQTGDNPENEGDKKILGNVKHSFRNAEMTYVSYESRVGQIASDLVQKYNFNLFINMVY